MARIKVDGGKVHAIRLERSMEIEGLAMKADVSVQTLADVEAGRRQHMLERTFFRLARALDVPPKALEPEDTDVRQGA